jgi:hypothetical protein
MRSASYEYDNSPGRKASSRRIGFVSAVLVHYNRQPGAPDETPTVQAMYDPISAGTASQKGIVKHSPRTCLRNLRPRIPLPPRWGPDRAPNGITGRRAGYIVRRECGGAVARKVADNVHNGIGWVAQPAAGWLASRESRRVTEGLGRAGSGHAAVSSLTSPIERHERIGGSIDACRHRGLREVMAGAAPAGPFPDSRSTSALGIPRDWVRREVRNRGHGEKVAARN